MQDNDYRVIIVAFPEILHSVVSHMMLKFWQCALGFYKKSAEFIFLIHFECRGARSQEFSWV